ncbi:MULTISPECIES: universal stress protein [Streptomyces]|uniref:universal stress protein n=1 Tax=Streptomyces TaxID=1883 RepID=UPI00163BC539|nr:MULTISPECIES: universal stress protein [Streptomyces]MBC2876575.1 universal stress protein [Streptomyces sp. TYQ1024]UBI40754.1 universal stress protein [Streptomyces mobaraensis]UKW33334.1 universal stress protein [Streptomyces sp. TYQ1024]
MPGTIAVGVDGTDHSRAAAGWAAAEAARRGMELCLVHASVRRPRAVVPADDAAARERWAADVLRDAGERAAKEFPGLTVITRQVAADPVPALIAEAAGADLLVLGSRGHGTVVGHLLGSVGLHVLRQATGPVVVVRGPRDDDRRGSGRYADGPADDPAPGEVVVGVQDLEERGAAVLDFAFAAAERLGTRLRAVRAWTVPPVFAWSPGSLWLAEEGEGMDERERGSLDEVLRPWRERHPAVDVAVHVETGSAAEVLLAHGAGAALVVVGRRLPGRHGVHRLGPVALAALHHAPGPVAVVPHP